MTTHEKDHSANSIPGAEKASALGSGGGCDTGAEGVVSADTKEGEMSADKSPAVEGPLEKDEAPLWWELLRRWPLPLCGL